MTCYQVYFPCEWLSVNNKAKVWSHEVLVQDLQQHHLHKPNFDPAFYLLTVCPDLYRMISLKLSPIQHFGQTVGGEPCLAMILKDRTLSTWHDCGKDTIRYILLQVLAPYKLTLTVTLQVCWSLVSEKSFLDLYSCGDLQPTSLIWQMTWGLFDMNLVHPKEGSVFF